MKITKKELSVLIKEELLREERHKLLIEKKEYEKKRRKRLAVAIAKAYERAPEVFIDPEDNESVFDPVYSIQGIDWELGDAENAALDNFFINWAKTLKQKNKTHYEQHRPSPQNLYRVLVNANYGN
jgi:hypothetical protein